MSNSRIFALGFVTGAAIECLAQLFIRISPVGLVVPLWSISSGMFCGSFWVAIYGDRSQNSREVFIDRVPLYAGKNTAFGYRAGHTVTTGAENTFMGSGNDKSA